MIMCAEVTGSENGRLMVVDSASQQEVAVNTNCLNFNKGDKVKIIYNGIMTMSIPPQISADRIIRMYDDNAGPYLIKYNEILEDGTRYELKDGLAKENVKYIVKIGMTDETADLDEYLAQNQEQNQIEVLHQSKRCYIVKKN